jgi:hypothetical protein
MSDADTDLMCPQCNCLWWQCEHADELYAAAQPALPGAETVRETEIATPAYALPEQTPPTFTLDGGTVPPSLLADLFTKEN